MKRIASSTVGKQLEKHDVIFQKKELPVVFFILKYLRYIGICPFKITGGQLIVKITVYNIVVLVCLHSYAAFYFITRLYSLAFNRGIFGMFTRAESFLRIGCCVFSVDMLFFKRKEIHNFILDLESVQSQKKKSRAMYIYTLCDLTIFLINFAFAAWTSHNIPLKDLKQKWDGNIFSSEFIDNFPAPVRIVLVFDSVFYSLVIFCSAPCRLLLVSFCLTLQNTAKNNLSYSKPNMDIRMLHNSATQLKVLVTKLDSLYKNLIFMWCLEEIILATIGTSRLISDFMANGKFSQRIGSAIVYISKEISAFISLSLSAANIPVCYKSSVDDIQENILVELEPQNLKLHLERQKVVDMIGFYKLELTGADTFSLTRSFTTTVCSGVVTFIVLLVQFTPKSED